jgi:hypothetical protein
MQESIRLGSTLCSPTHRHRRRKVHSDWGGVLRSHRRYYCEGAEVPEVAPACGLGDRGGRGEAGSPPVWPCRSPSEPSTRIPNPRDAATLDARDRDEDIGSCGI